MSAVISRTQQQYRRIFRVQIGLLLVACAVVVGGSFSGLSFLCGGLAGFLPHCLFVYWVFFRQSPKNRNKMQAFYRGEGLKWLATIGLIVACLTGYSGLQVGAFFMGYFLMLLCNGLLPIILRRQAK